MNILKGLFTITFTILIFFSGSIVINADEGNGISVSPIKIQKNYKGNDSEKVLITLLNNESEEVVLGVNLRSFKLINNNQEILFDESIDETILNWIRNFKNTVVLKPKERYEYPLELVINPDTPPGGYLFTLLFETITDNNNSINETKTSIKQSIGVPFIVNVAGVQGISYGDISLDTFDIGYNYISNGINYSVTILNNSNQIITPTGVITLKKQFGIGPDVLNSEFNSEGRIVNSFSLRNYTKDIYFNQLVLGQYEVSLNFLYGLENNVYTQKSRVFIIPIWLIIIILGIIIFIIRKLKRKNV